LSDGLGRVGAKVCLMEDIIFRNPDGDFRLFLLVSSSLLFLGLFLCSGIYSFEKVIIVKDRREIDLSFSSRKLRYPYHPSSHYSMKFKCILSVDAKDLDTESNKVRLGLLGVSGAVNCLICSLMW
jgi:hypothetical protein